MNDPWQAFTHPVVRDLAWLIGTPPLLSPSTDAAGFEGVFWPSTDYFHELLCETTPLLHALDQDPSALIAHSENSRDYRLGTYVERLLSFWLAHPQNPRFELVAANLAIRENGITLGELDYIVCDKRDNSLAHWELAVKFYLGRPEADIDQQWLGPGLHDRLDIKRDHLCRHQLAISQKALAHEVINAHLVTNGYPPLTEKIARVCWLKGRLFAAADPRWTVADPTQGNSCALRGTWSIIINESTEAELPRLRGSRLHQTHWHVGPDWPNTAYSPRR